MSEHLHGRHVLTAVVATVMIAHQAPEGVLLINNSAHIAWCAVRPHATSPACRFWHGKGERGAGTDTPDGSNRTNRDERNAGDHSC